MREIRVAFISSSSRLSSWEAGGRTFWASFTFFLFIQWQLSSSVPESVSVLTLFYKRKIFQRNNFLAHINMMRLPPPLITLDRSDGVQTTAAFPSHPTWGPGIPIAWSPALVHTLQLCSRTPHCLKEENTPEKTPIQYMLNVSLIGHLQCNVMYFEDHHGCVIV